MPTHPHFQMLGRVEPKRYQIVVRGQLSERFVEALDGMVVQRCAGVTAFEGDLADQAMLHGLLGRIGGLGLELVSVMELGSDNDARTSHRCR